jgi:hypothetical protein
MWSRLRVLVLLLLVVFAACGDGGGDDEADTDGSKLARSPAADDESDQGEACDLLDDDDLADLFPDGAPDPSGTSMGAGFAECGWGNDDDVAQVLVSVLPADDYRSDYLEQLNVTTPVTGLGDEAVTFPGFVGVGRGSATGGSVGFVIGDEAVIVAVRSTGDPAADAAQAAALGVAVEAAL